MIVGISGLAGSGKDTVADRLVEKHRFVKVAMADPLKRICQEVYDFSDEQLWGPSEKRNAPDERYPRKVVVHGQSIGKSTDAPEAVREYLTPRLALQLLGSEWGRHCYPNTWVDLAIRTAKRLEEGGCYYDVKSGLRTFSSVDGVMSPKTNVAIPDVRFRNEMNAIKRAGGKLVRVVRPGAGLTGAASQHVSETEQLSFKDEEFDWVVDNSSSLHMLMLKIDSMMDRFTGRIRDYNEGQEDVPPFLRK